MIVRNVVVGKVLSICVIECHRDGEGEDLEELSRLSYIIERGLEPPMTGKYRLE